MTLTQMTAATDSPDLATDGQQYAGLKSSGLLQALINTAKALPTVRMGVVHPCDAVSLSSALEARKLGLIDLVRPTLGARFSVGNSASSLTLRLPEA